MPGTLPPDSASSSRMTRALPEAELYTQLCYFMRLLVPELAAQRAGKTLLECEAAQARLAPIAPVLAAGAMAADALRARNAFRWVDLGALLGVRA